MNVFQRVTRASLLKNKMRTIVTIIGIMLSVSLITAVSTTVATVQNFLVQYTIYSEGNWQAKALHVSVDEIEDMAQDDRMKAFTFLEEIGYAKIDSKSRSQPYLYVVATENPSDDMLPIHITAGRFPKTANEILLPEHLADKGEVYKKLGSSLQLALGDRSADGEVLHQETGLMLRDGATDASELLERFTPKEEKQYTVVGYYTRPTFEDWAAPGFTAITRYDGPDLRASAQIEAPDASHTFDVYYQLHDPKDIEAFDNTHGIASVRNRDLLLFQGYSTYGSFYSILYGLATIVIILVMLGSVALIYNAFSISVAERTKQFGLLRSVGATQRQLKKSVFYEARVLSLIGIPLGILLGIVGMGITFHFLGDNFAVSVGWDGATMSLVVSPIAIVLAVVIAVVTIFISAWIPAKRAMQISAIDAIRQTRDITIERPKSVSKYMYRMFGLPAVLAAKYYDTSKKKYRATILSLFISVVLFVSAYSFASEVSKTISMVYYVENYDVVYLPDEIREGATDAKTLMAQAANDDRIVASGIKYSDMANLMVDKTAIHLDRQESAWANWSGDASKRKEDFVTAVVLFLDDRSFDQQLEKKGLDRNAYYDANRPLPLVFSYYRDVDYDTETISSGQILLPGLEKATLQVPKEIPGYENQDEYVQNADGTKSAILRKIDNPDITKTVPLEDAMRQREIPLGTTVDDVSFPLVNSNVVTLVYPISQIDNSLFDILDTSTMSLALRTPEHSAVTADMKANLQAQGIPASGLVDFGASTERISNIVFIFTVFAYGFIVLISLISIANVINTISTNIQLRHRDIAMLRSVGMDRRGLNQMMVFECIVFGSKALLWGIPVSLLFSYVIHRVVVASLVLPYEIPWVAIGISALTVFVVVFVTTMYAVRKMKRESPIDALQEENL